MKLSELISLLNKSNIPADLIILNDVPLTSYDMYDSEYVNLLDVPVYSYQTNSDGKVLRYYIETMWS